MHLPNKIVLELPANRILSGGAHRVLKTLGFEGEYPRAS